MQSHLSWRVRSSPSLPTTSHRSSGTSPKASQLVSPQQPFVLELYAGCGRLTAACLDSGLHAAPPIEIGKGKWHDLHNPRIFAVIKGLIRSGVIWFCHFGTPCTFWSVATGDPEKHRASGLTAARRTLSLLHLCRRCRVHWSIENPAGSGLFRWAPLVRFFKDSKAFYVHVA